MAFSKGHIPYNKGKKRSIQTIEKVRKSVLQKYKEDKTYKKRVSITTKKAMENPDLKKYMSEKSKELWQDEEWRLNWSKTASKNRRGEKHWNYKNGKKIPKIRRPLEWNQRIIRKIRKRDNNKCVICSKNNKENNNYDMDVHHIDYGINNLNEKNLICLCKSCHGKTRNKKKQKYYYDLLVKKIDNIYLR